MNLFCAKILILYLKPWEISQVNLSNLLYSPLKEFCYYKKITPKLGVNNKNQLPMCSI